MDQFRREIGKYVKEDEVARLEQYVLVPIDLNSASDEDILSIPGLGRRMLREIHEKSLHELEDVLSPDLKRELDEVVFPFTSTEPTESELRIAQAQLVGWLEGLFHGIQATLFTQQAMAQNQFEEMRRRRALEAGGLGGPAASGPQTGYL